MQRKALRSTCSASAGEFKVYAGGWALSSGYKAFYYIDKDKGLNSGEDIIFNNTIKIINDLFNYYQY